MLYHASRTPGLAVLEPRVSTHGKPYVYAVDSAVTALLFGAPKDDFDLLTDAQNGVPVVWECRPNALRAVYAGKRCSLYTVAEDGFLAGQTGWAPERVCETPVRVASEERVPDLYDWIDAARRRGACVLHRFRADAEYHAFLLGEFRERIAAFGLTERAVRADARLAPFWDELYPSGAAGAGNAGALPSVLGQSETF